MLASLSILHSFTCQVSLNALSMCSRFPCRGVEGDFQLRGCGSDAQPTPARRQFHSRPVVIKKSSLSQFLTYVFRFCLQCHNQRYELLGATTFASMCRALATDFEATCHKASAFLVLRWSCVIAAPPSRRPQAKDSSSSSAAVDVH